LQPLERAKYQRESHNNCGEILWAYWRGGVFYQQLFVKGPRSEYFEVARGHDLASLETDWERTEVAVQQATQAFQAKSNEARKKEMDIIEEMGDLAAPNSWLRRLGSTAHLKDFSINCQAR
jgi:hypothetical protein